MRPDDPAQEHRPLEEGLRRARWDLAEGRLDTAAAELERVLGADPGHLEGRLLRAHEQKLRRLGPKPAELDGLIAELEAGRPGTLELLVEGLRLRVMLDLEAGRGAEALPDLRRALELDPSNGELLQACGAVLNGLGRFDEALPLLERAGATRGDQAAYWNALGLALHAEGRLERALAAFDRAAQLEPQNFHYLMCLAQGLAESGRVLDTAPLLERALELSPGNPAVVSGLLGTALYDARRTPAELARLHRAWVESLEARVEPLPEPPRAGDPEGVVTVAYLSPDFREHSCASFLEALLEAHDRRHFRIVLVFTAERRDARTDRFERLADEWIEAWKLDDAALAERLRASAVDVLVDLAGHTGYNRLPVLARRPAAVQLSWLGYPFSTGLSRLEGRITDSLVDPPGAEALGSEPLLRLDPCYLCWRPPAGGPEPAKRPPSAEGLPFTFGSFNHFAKLNGGVIGTWARILRRTPGSRLLLKGKGSGDRVMRERVQSAFEAEGVPRGRLLLEDWAAGNAPHLEQYRKVDLGLDPFPYNGVTTSLECLWMGVPFVALQGVHSLSRHGLMILANLGLGQLAAKDPAIYVDLAVALAQDPGRLAGLRAGLRERLLGSPLCDAQGFARRIEALYRERLLARIRTA